MRKLVFFLVLVFVLSISLQVIAADFKHVGAKKCKMCHKGQHSKWSSAGHSKAFKTLATAEAKKIAAEKGIKDATKSADCLKCHSSAYDPKSGKKRANAGTAKDAEGVSCESCHGPGSKYKSKSNMIDHKKFMAAGGIMPTENVCVSCHNSASPTYKPFDFKKRVKDIAHPNKKK